MNPTTITNWSATMHNIIDPYTSGLPSTTINLGNSEGYLASMSNDFGIL